MSNDEKTAQFGICRYCQQTVMFQSEKEWTDEDGGAAMHCACEGAIAHQRAEAAYHAVRTVCVEQAEERGFSVLDTGTVDKIMAACDGVVSGEVEQIALRVSDEDTIRLKLKLGRVFVKRIRKIEVELA